MKFRCIFFIVISFLSCKNEDLNLVQLISIDEFIKFSKINEVQLVDVRTPKEYANGHILNSKNIDFLDTNFELYIKKLDKKLPIIVYCQSGGRSAKSALKLTSNSYVKVYDLEGGFSRWLSNGGNVEK
ncbi:rhodanese-like domain-containing protein [Flavobacteriaceae bacterium]|jgi:rhodanese-related sulfurtransferase|nr:rhodanese-like domain-containing protein [Flavobacteriaceae bacterium]